MNYFAHALPHLHRPYFVAGTAVPDWMSVADRPVRVRPRLAAPLIDCDDPSHRELAAGVLQHFHDDYWFHATLGFARVTTALTAMFRQLAGGSEEIRASFLGHIVTEMLLDAVLIERYPQELVDYYLLLDGLEPAVIETAVNRMARKSTQRLAPLIPHFVRERFLEDYANASGMLHRLNQVLRRVKLAALPSEAVRVLTDARPLVAAHLLDLLPPEHYGLHLAAPSTTLINRGTTS